MQALLMNAQEIQADAKGDPKSWRTVWRRPTSISNEKSPYDKQKPQIASVLHLGKFKSRS